MLSPVIVIIRLYYTIKKDENVVVHIAATVNSLYCNGITVRYKRVTEALAAPVIHD